MSRAGQPRPGPALPHGHCHRLWSTDQRLEASSSLRAGYSLWFCTRPWTVVRYLWRRKDGSQHLYATCVYNVPAQCVRREQKPCLPSSGSPMQPADDAVERLAPGHATFEVQTQKRKVQAMSARIRLHQASDHFRANPFLKPSLLRYVFGKLPRFACGSVHVSHEEKMSLYELEHELEQEHNVLFQEFAAECFWMG